MAQSFREFFNLGFTATGLAQPEQKERPDQVFGFGLFGLVAASIGTLLAFAVVLLCVATLLSVLRKKQNPTYWELASWALVVIGIVARQTIQPTHNVVLSGLTPSLMLASAMVSLAVLPALMRWLNRVSRTPTLQHVAVPFSLGFFLDYAQVLASKYVIHLPWVPVGG